MDGSYRPVADLTKRYIVLKMVFMRRNFGPVFLLAASATLLLTGCGQATESAGTTAEGAKLTIVAAAYPFQFVAERVAGQHGEVSSLTQPGAEPHDLELTPQQTADVIEADLVVYEKTFQAAVDDAVAQSGKDNALDTTTVVPLQDLGTEHEHEEEHAEGGEPGGEEHAEGEDEHAEESGLDPHVWLDPTQMATIGNAVAEKLGAVDPDRAADYAANAKSLETELTTLDQEYTSGLQNCERTEFITSHEAFGYLAKRYGLTQIGISGLSPDAEPSPARIAEVQTEAKEHGVTTIFYETLVSPDVAKSIAGDLGLKTDVLDPLEGITPESRGTDYVAVMKSNLAALTAANGCR
jgi:zinc transport system substrate-binding protein